MREARPGTFRNPPGFYFALVRDDVRPPDTFLTTGKLQETSRGSASEEQAAQRDQKRAYARYREQQAQAAFDAIPAEQRAARVAERRREYARKFPSLPSQTLEEISMQAARREIEESLPLMPLEEFSRRSASVPDGPNGPAGSKDH